MVTGMVHGNKMTELGNVLEIPCAENFRVGAK